MPVTPNRGYPFPSLTDAPDVPADMSNLAMALDSDIQGHDDAVDPHTQYVKATGDTMTGPLTIDSSSGSGTGLIVKRDNAMIGLYSKNSPADKRWWTQVVSVADGRYNLVSLKDDGSSGVYCLVADRDGGAWMPQLPDPDEVSSTAGSIQFTGANQTWANLGGAHNLGVNVYVPHRALCLVEYGVWGSIDAPTTSTGYFAVSFDMSGATVLSDPDNGGKWGQIPRVVNRAGNPNDMDETINGTRVVTLNAGTTTVRLKGFVNYASAQSGKYAYTAYPVLRVTPLRFVP